jgi:S1-C subfamily serine protease
VGAGIATAALLVAPGIAGAQGGGASPQERATTLASPAVVFVLTSVDLNVKLGDQVQGRRFEGNYSFDYGSGSGFAVSQDGAIVTASHVVEPSEAQLMNRGANEIFCDLFTEFGFPEDCDLFTQDPFGRYFITSRGWPQALQLLYNRCYQGRACEFRPEVNISVFTATNVAGTDVAEGQAAELLHSTGFESTDVAVIKINTTNQPTVALAQSAGDLASGDEIVALGFPGSAQNLPSGFTEPQKAFGHVSNIRSEGTTQVVEVDADLEGGFSGGPVVNNSGQVIGLVSFTILQDTGEAAQQYLRTVDDIRTALGAAGVQARRGPVDTAFQDAMNLFWDNHFSAAVPQYRNVTSLSPGHPLATKYLSEAQGKAGTAADVPVEEEGGLPIIPIAVGAGVVVVIVIVVLVVVSRRKKPAPAVGAPAGYAAAPPTGAPSGFGAPAQTPGGTAAPPAAPPAGPPAGVGTPQAADEHRPVGFQAQPPAGESTVSERPDAGTGEAPPPPGIGAAKFCSNCGMENASDATFCARCGHTLS